MAQYWLRLQDLILLLSEINIVNEELMKLADSIHCWEDTAYVILGDSPIENDSERTKKFQNFKIDFFPAEVSVHKYFNDMKVTLIYSFVAGLFDQCKLNVIFPTFNRLKIMDCVHGV